MKRLTLFSIIACVFVTLLVGCIPQQFVTPDTIHYPLLRFSLPTAERVELDNGIVLYILEDHELPLVNISAVIRTGSIYDPPGKEGLAEITATVMRTGGTETMTGDEIDEELDSMASNISISVGKETGTASLSVLKDDIDKGLTLFSRIIMRPVFDDGKLALAKDLKGEALKRVYDNPQELAFREFSRLFYHGNPRGRLSSIRSVKTIEKEDLIRFHKRFFFPANIMMAVTGDISKVEAISKINTVFGTWQATGTVEKIPAPVAGKGRFLNYLYKDIPQSIIILGNLGPGKRDPDYYAFEVLDFILGSGGFRSRIFNEVRSTRGLAYSAGSFYSPRVDYGVFGAYAMTKTSSTATTLSVIRSIVKEVKTTPIHTEELLWAKKSIDNTFIFSFTSPGKIAFQQLMMEYNNLAEDFLETYRDRIDKVSEEDLQRVARKYLPEASETLLIVGDAKYFDKPLSSFGKVKEIHAHK